MTPCLGQRPSIPEAELKRTHSIVGAALRYTASAAVIAAGLSIPAFGQAQPYSPQSLSFSVSADTEVVREDCRFAVETENAPADDQARAFRVGRKFDPPVSCAPRAILVDTLSDDVLFERAADEQTLQGSISKILTAGVALSAARDGIVALDDPVAISARARRQCTCIRDADGDGVSDLQVGETLTLDGLLHATLMLSAGEATDAVAEHIAAAMVDVTVSTPSENVSELLMNYFLGLMNERAAEIPLSNSRFVTVHGGDSCNFGIGCVPDLAPDCEGFPCLLSFFLPPNCEDPDAGEAALCRCADSSLCEPSGTTARDLVTLWRDIATQTPEFVEIAGRRNITIPSGLNGQLNSYGLNQAFGYSPGVDADKGGNSGRSRASLISQSTWLGRTLVGVVLNGPDSTAREADMSALLDFGYTEIFMPDLRATSNPLQTVHDHALVCASQNRVVSAFITDPERDLRLVTWNLDVGSGEIMPLAPPADSPDGVVTPATLPEEVDATHMGNGILVVGVRRGQNVQLMTWGIAANGPPFVINGGVSAGHGTDVRIEALNNRILVSALRNSQDEMLLQTWRVSADGATIEPLDTAQQQPLAQEFDLATRSVGLTGRVLTVSLRNGRRDVRSWRVDTQSGTEGQITLVETDNGAESTSVLGVTAVPMPLESPLGVAFVTADRTNQGRLRLVVWAVEPAGDLSFLGNSGSTGPNLGIDDPVGLAPMRQAGLLATIGNGVQAQLTVWGLDIDNPGDGFTTAFPVVENSQVAATLLDTCSVPSSEAEGDVIVAFEHSFEQGQPLTLSAWRSGPRP